MYRRGSTYYCSDLCMDAAMVKDMNAINEAVKRRKELAMAKITLEQKKKAVEIAVSGGNPLDYLKKCGSARPDGLWYTIKENLKKVDPDTYAKLPDYRGKTRPKPANYGQPIPGFEASDPEEEAPTVKVDGPLRIETKEPEKVEVVEPENPTRIIRKMFGFEVSAIRDDVMGEFYYDIKFNRIDWRSPDGTEVSLSPTAWKTFSEKIPAVLNALGVKL